MFHPIDKYNVHLRNALDVDLKIMWLKNVQSKYFYWKGYYSCENGESNSECKIYACLAQMYSNDEWENHGKTENWDRTLVQEGW